MVYFEGDETTVCLRMCLSLSGRTSNWIAQFGSCDSERSSYK